MTTSVGFVAAKKKARGELRLPQLHFIVCDDWMKKLGRTAFCAWLEFYTYADRTRTLNTTGGDSIPNSMNKIAKKLGVSKETFYNNVIRPLWNYGLIDLQPVDINGNQAVNIIVYEYPQNDKKLETEPLLQIRDFDKDYQTETRKKAKNASHVKAVKKEASSKIEPPTQFENRTTTSSKIEPPPVRKSNHPSSKIEPNNVLDSFNDLNNSNVLNICQSVRKRFTDRLTELNYSIESISNFNELAESLSLSDEQALNALELTIASAKKTKRYFWNYISVVFTEKASIAKKESMIRPDIPQDKLPESVQRQLEMERQQELGLIEVSAASDTSDIEDPEMKELLAQIRQLR